MARTLSSAGPSRVNRPRRSSALTSNGSAASSTGTADGARTGVCSESFMSGDCEVMALYLGSAGGNRKGRRARWTITAPVVPANAFLLPLSPCGRGCLSEAKAGEGVRPLVLWRPLTRLEFAALILATLPQGERGRRDAAPSSGRQGY